MTRKKFVKQLMARGCSRNAAQAWAYACRIRGESYEEALPFAAASVVATNDFAEMLARIAESIKPAIEDMLDSIRRAAEELCALDWSAAIEAAKALGGGGDE